MKFWDSSAIIALLVRGHASERIADVFRDDTAILAWWGTEVECVSALSRQEREAPSAAAIIEGAFDRLHYLMARWHEIQPTPAVRTNARRLLRTHPLRAADALQLAAAIVGAEGMTSSLPFVCLDERLTAAAKREGFPVLPV